MSSTRYLGIDLGGCMSGTTAFCLIETNNHTDFRILEFSKEVKHTDAITCFESFKAKLESSKATFIGIDAPLSVPRALVDANFTSLPREGKGEILNPYLFRHTDYYLYATFGLRPMPPCGDRIGRLTARMMEFSHKAPELFSKCIELYPKQIAQALHLDRTDAASIFHFFGLSHVAVDAHQIDALLAAYATMRINAGHTTQPLGNDGWCYPLLN